MKDFINYYKKLPRLNLQSFAVTFPLIIVVLLTLLVEYALSFMAIIIVPFIIVPFYFMTKRLFESYTLRNTEPGRKRIIFQMGLNRRVRDAFAPFLTMIIGFVIMSVLAAIVGGATLSVLSAHNPTITQHFEEIFRLLTNLEDVTPFYEYLAAHFEVLWPIIVIPSAIMYFGPILYIAITFIYRTFILNYTLHPAVFNKRQTKQDLATIYRPTFKAKHVGYLTLVILVPTLLSLAGFSGTVALLLVKNPALRGDISTVYLIGGLVGVTIFCLFLPLFYKFNYAIYEYFLDLNAIPVANQLSLTLEFNRTLGILHPAQIKIAEIAIESLKKRGQVVNEDGKVVNDYHDVTDVIISGVMTKVDEDDDNDDEE